MQLRSRSADDDAFLRLLFEEARPELSSLALPAPQRALLIEQQWRAQEETYERTFPGLRDRIVVVDGHRVGRLAVAKTQTEVRVVDVALTASARGSGLGTQLLRGVLDEAAELRLPTRLTTLTHGRAVAFYLRLGFVPLQPVDPSGAYVVLERRPDREPPPAPTKAGQP